MKKKNIKLLVVIALLVLNTTIKAQSTKAEQDETAKAKEWISSLSLNDNEKENRLVQVVATHLSAVKDWHNNHPASTVPAGINPLDGKPLSELHRQIIADSAMPTNVHESLMSGLRKDLSEQQVSLVLDKYTIGKVAFTMKGYQAIVPEMTSIETAEIQKLMEKAREQAVDYKSMKEISAIFEIYKTQAESYLNNHGRNWRQMYGDYTKKIKAEKEAAAKK
ncbi:cytochrome c553 [Flavobacterium nitrogenifigens]|uniref:Cytochrome c553 n=2 Tax=Flavobacterium TaxID=237 RepID=A0A7W7N9Z2_9FLAO|nr:MULTISPECIES: DUF3826 domain-containing protein [Flavobacterium]MBB4803957.1 cytochrome c553 [Flavobacterium nitrogenifigens]MBB6388891.1 cytochrome c553 [Flavobacterium notoginsengisoli]